MASKQKQEAQNPLILRCHRLMEAFAKSNEERDFYLDRVEGFIVYADLDKTEEELDKLEKELKAHSDRYCPIPKLSFYETKKIMEGFVNEKVYDIDTKEKLLDIIQSKEARENFLEFIYDHHSEYDKWQQYYQERSRIRIIEWLRNNHFHFVFEEDLDMPRQTVEKLKLHLFDPKPAKDVLTARKALGSKAKTYYSTEALNPRPKRGRPPKQAVKLEVEPQVSTDIYTTVPQPLRVFLFTPDITSASGVTFSSKFENEDELLAHRRHQTTADRNIDLEDFNQKLASLRSLSSKWVEAETKKGKKTSKIVEDFDADDEEEEFEEEDFEEEEEGYPSVGGEKIPSKPMKGKATQKKTSPAKRLPTQKKGATAKTLKPSTKKTPPKKTIAPKKAEPAKKTRLLKKAVTPKKSVPPSKAAPVKKSSPPKAVVKQKKGTPKAMTVSKASIGKPPIRGKFATKKPASRHY